MDLSCRGNLIWRHFPLFHYAAEVGDELAGRLWSNARRV